MISAQLKSPCCDKNVVSPLEPFDLRLWPLYPSSGGSRSSPAIVDQVVIDSRRVASSSALFVALKGRCRDGHDHIAEAAQLGARYAIVDKKWIPPSPLPPLLLLRVDSPIDALQSLASAYRQQHSSCYMVAIGGTHGKTMCKDLLRKMAHGHCAVAASPESFNSQIGVALSLFTIKRTDRIALIEAAISRPGEIDKLKAMIDPAAVVVSHIGKKHTTTMGDIDATCREIARLIDLPDDGWALLPDNPLLDPFLHNSTVRRYCWQRDDGQLPHAHFVSEAKGKQMEYRVTFPSGPQWLGVLKSNFNYALNIINAAIKAAWLLKTPPEAIIAALRDHIIEPTRTEIWRAPLGTTLINDSYGSDPQSIDRALAFYDTFPNPGRKIFCFSGVCREKNYTAADWRRIGTALKASKVEVLIGAGVQLPKELVHHCSPAKSVYCPTDHSALSYMATHLKGDDIVVIKGAHKIPFDAIAQTFNGSIYNNLCIINLAAIRNNIELFSHKLPKDTRLMVMVKALAYGTDDLRIAAFLSSIGIEIFGVSYVDEAIALRRGGLQSSLFVINAAPYEAEKVAAWELEVAAGDQNLIKALESSARNHNKRVKIHLHIDTGMGRFGCRPDIALSLAQQIESSPYLQLEGVMTHFACADNPDSDLFTIQQTERFDSAISQLEKAGINPRWRHAANSSAALRFNFPQYNMVRIGLAAYGLGGNSELLEPAMSLRSRIVAINECLRGETVSYGRRYTIDKPRGRIAVLPIGYFDGIHRSYSGSNSVIIHGSKAPMVGDICMDFMMVDISEIAAADVGDPVLIFGADEHGCYASPEEFARRGDSIVHELMTCLGPRIQRLFIYEESAQ